MRYVVKFVFHLFNLIVLQILHPSLLCWKDKPTASFVSVKNLSHF